MGGWVIGCRVRGRSNHHLPTEREEVGWLEANGGSCTGRLFFGGQEDVGAVDHKDRVLDTSEEVRLWRVGVEESMG